MMNSKIQTLASQFFGPRYAVPQELKYDGHLGVAKVGSIEQLGYPQYFSLSVGGNCWSNTYTQFFTDIRVKTGDIVNPGDVLALTRGDLTHHLEKITAHEFKGDVDRAELLLEIIKQWAGKPIGCFCNGEGALEHFDYNKWVVTPEENRRQTPLGWKDPSTCSSCVETQEIIESILGKKPAPFVVFKGDRRYGIDLAKLITFVNEGPEALAAAEKKRQEEQIEAHHRQYEATVTEALQGAEVSDVVRTGLVQFRVGGGYWSGIKVVSEDLVVTRGERSEYGDAGGVGKFDEVRVWYKGQTARQEWQWRDRYNPNCDRFDLRVHSIGHVSTEPKKGTMVIKVELENSQYGNRFATYTFEDKELESKPDLPMEEQIAFEQYFQGEVERVLAILMELLPRKPYMLMDNGQKGEYRSPKIKQSVIHTNQGVGAFVIEEQIDHSGSDRQMRHNLYVLKQGWEKVELKADDHGYNKREGGALLTILDVNQDKILINTKHGESEIKL